MDLFTIDDTKHSLREKIEKGSRLCTPLILTAAITLSLSYIIDYVYNGSSGLAIGETSALAKILYRNGTLINKLISPVLSGGIALYTGGFSALSAGLIGGMLTGIGVTLNFPSGNSEAITGIYGCILAGLAAGYSVKVTENIQKRFFKNKSDFHILLPPIISIILTVTAVFTADTISHTINGLVSAGIAASGDYNKLLLAIILSVMISADVGGPLYLAALVYAVASFGTNEPEIIALVTAAGSVPALSIGLSSIIFADRFTKKERYYATTGMFCGLLGLSQIVIPYYLSRFHRIIIPCVTGAVISGCLSFIFGCTLNSPVGGILAVSDIRSAVYFIISVISGVLFSTAVMGYTLYPANEGSIVSEERKTSSEKIPA